MGEKPYLHIEVDEHFSRVGVMTRIEAFINAIKTRPTFEVSESFTDANYFSALPKRKLNLSLEPNIFYPVYIPNLYPFSQLAKDKFKHWGLKVLPLPETTAQSLSMGTQHAQSKEYITFSQLLGDIIYAHNTIGTKQVFIPQTEGAELDGVYARVISGILTTLDIPVNIMTGDDGKNSVTIESLYLYEDIFDIIFPCIIAGDIILAVPKHMRAALIEQLFMDRVSIARLKELAEQAKMFIPSDNKVIQIIGDPYVVYNQFFVSKIEEPINDAGITMRYQLLSEYLLYMWYQRAVASSKAEIEFVLSAYDDLLDVFSPLNYPFEASLQSLYDLGEEHLPFFHGGNGQYRLAKKLTTVNADALIEIVCMYEQTQNMMALQNLSPKIPSICIGIEETQGFDEKLEILISYVLQKN